MVWWRASLSDAEASGCPDLLKNPGEKTRWHLRPPVLQREPETEAGGEGKDEEAGGRGVSPEGPEKWLQWEE